VGETAKLSIRMSDERDEPQSTCKEEPTMSLIKHYRELEVYQNAMALVVRVFELTRSFPSEERFSLIDQMRRSSRSVCTNLAEAWRKRRYEAAFIAKLSDSEAEAAETQVSAEIALKCGYLDEKAFRELDDAYDKILGQLVKMADQPEKWVIPPRSQRKLP
jgi:four helix bundle protein